MQSHAEVQEYAANLIVKVIEALTRESTNMSVSEAGSGGAEPKPKDIVFKGTYEEINRFFYESQWTDGLPIVPPTTEKVQEFLRYTDRSPDEALGTLPPGNREATVWTVAVNGVMAGCRPEYMPALIAVSEAVADPRFGMQFAGSTAGWSPVIIVNGPIIKQLDFNYGQGVMRSARQANTTLSRFLRLFMLNVPRYVVGMDKAAFGQNIIVAIAENEDDSPWESLSVSRGFKTGVSVVTVTSAEAVSDNFETFGTGEEQLKGLARQTAKVLGQVPFCLSSFFGPERSVVVALTPLVARTIAKAGYSKSDVQQYLFKNVKIRAAEFDMFLPPGFFGGTACGFVAAGKMEKQFCESTDADRMLPLVHSPKDYLIIITGDAARNRNFVTLQGGDQGFAVSKAIRLPVNWQSLIRATK